jgi:hypothetical protein
LPWLALDLSHPDLSLPSRITGVSHQYLSDMMFLKFQEDEPNCHVKNGYKGGTVEAEKPVRG